MSKQLLRKEAIIGYIFVAPLVFFILMFVAYPLLTLIYLSFNEKFIGSPEKFIGLDNFYQLFKEPAYIASVRNTIIFIIADVTIKLSIAFGLALILNRNFRGRSVARASLLVPWLTPIVPAVLTWHWILHRDFGILNKILLVAGIINAPIEWLGKDLALTMIIIVHVWKYFPFFTLIFLAGLQAIPTELYEVAEIDGADRLRKFRYITIPYMKNLFKTMYLLSTVWTMAEFVIIWLLTRGGPLYATHVFSTVAYVFGFYFYNLGLAAAVFTTALPVTLFLIFLVTKYMRGS
jgi:ABC-type sugar transport system permease subunit